MDAKTVIYAALGAPVAAVKVVNDRVAELQRSLDERGETLSDAAARQLEAWATEGQDLLGRMSDGTVIDDIASRVDFGQARQQVARVRDRLEERLAGWRASLRPEAAPPQPSDPAPDEDDHRDEGPATAS